MNLEIARLGTTIFEQMSALAHDHGAINLGQGFPDSPAPAELLEAAARALYDKSNQYPPMRGIRELRSAVASYYSAHQGLNLGEEEVIITSGATEALAATLFALLNPGDEVILFQPLYDAYGPLVKRAGAVPRYVNLQPPDWHLPLDEVEAQITSRTHLLLLNSPHNPTGSLVSTGEWRRIGEICDRHDLIVVCDEVWEAMIFSGDAHRSALAEPSLRERAVKIGSAGKIFSLTGWKVGWICAAPPLADAISRMHQYLTFTTPPALQWAVAEGLALPATWHQEHREQHISGRHLLAEGLTKAGYAVQLGPATWFLLVDLQQSSISMPDQEFCERLVRNGGVAAIPLSAFYDEKPETRFVRFCFTKPPLMLEAATQRLASFHKGPDLMP